MRMKNFGTYIVAILSLAAALAFYCWFDLAGMRWVKQQSEVSAAQLEAGNLTDFQGYLAGDGISPLTSAREWEDALNTIDYLAAVPAGITETDVYSRANWTEAFARRRNGASGRRLADARKQFADYSDSYLRFYIVELPDGTKLLAQMEPTIARAAASGKLPTLPLGKKVGIPQTAKSLLGPLCDEQGISMSHMLYTVNDPWHMEHGDMLTIARIGISAALWFVLAVILELIRNWRSEPESGKSTEKS